MNNNRFKSVVFHIILFSVLLYWVFPIIWNNPFKITHLSIGIQSEPNLRGGHDVRKTLAIFTFSNNKTLILNYEVMQMTSLIAFFYIVFYVIIYFKLYNLDVGKIFPTLPLPVKILIYPLKIFMDYIDKVDEKNKKYNKMNKDEKGSP